MKLTLSGANSVEGRFTVTGGASNDIEFSVRDPSGTLVQPTRTVTGSYAFQFSAIANGEYRLYFDNYLSIATSRSVSYSITIHYK